MLLVTRKRRQQIQQVLGSLALAEHMGDIAEDLPRLAKALGLPEPEWNDEQGRLVWPWEASYVDPEDVVEAPFDPDWVSHPGATIASALEDKQLGPGAWRWTKEKSAARMGWTIGMFDRVLSGDEPITDAMALTLSMEYGGTQRFWINRERIFREGLAAGKVWSR